MVCHLAILGDTRKIFWREQIKSMERDFIFFEKLIYYRRSLCYGGKPSRKQARKACRKKEESLCHPTT